MDFETGSIFVKYFNFIRHFENSPLEFSEVTEFDSYKYWSMLALSNFKMISIDEMEHYPLTGGNMINTEKANDTIKNRANYVQECKSITKSSIKKILLAKGLTGHYVGDAYHLFNQDILIKISYSFILNTDILVVDGIHQIILVGNMETESEIFTNYHPKYLGEI